MPRGNTATIDFESLRLQWAAHIPIAHLCQNFTISRDQLTRLKFVLHLAPRHDRSLRYKPPREERLEDPTPEEEAASLAGLALAPMVAARVTCVQAHWTDREWRDRQVTKPQAYTLARIEVPDETREMMDDLNREVQW